MRMILLIAMLLAVSAPSVQALPDLEETLSASGGWRFAGPLGSDAGPTLVEISADGGCLVWFIDTSPLFLDTPGPVVRWIAGNPPWGDGAAGGAEAEGTGWPWSIPVGNTQFTLVSGLPRPFDIAGTGADSVEVIFTTASTVTISCSLQR